VKWVAQLIKLVELRFKKLKVRNLNPDKKKMNIIL
jgi:hypothetical protein